MEQQAELTNKLDQKAENEQRIRDEQTFLATSQQERIEFEALESIRIAAEKEELARLAEEMEAAASQAAEVAAAEEAER